MPERNVAKRKPAKCVRDPYEKLSTEEIRLAKMWNEAGGKVLSEIAEVLRRDKFSMTSLLAKQSGSEHANAHDYDYDYDCEYDYVAITTFTITTTSATTLAAAMATSSATALVEPSRIEL